MALRTRLDEPRSCAAFKQAKALASGGFYPTVSCLRHPAETGETTVSVERFASGGRRARTVMSPAPDGGLPRRAGPPPHPVQPSAAKAPGKCSTRGAPPGSRLTATTSNRQASSPSHSRAR